MEEMKDKIVVDDAVYETHLTAKYYLRKKFEPKDPKKVNAYIPGLIFKLFVKPGDVIKEGDKLMILEAMKMKNAVNSAQEGTIKAIHVAEGQNVMMNQLLLEFE
jgi:biotin carboxyl carrier protein